MKSAPPADRPPSPRPPSTRIEEVVDTVHGVRIADPYRWLEAGDSPDVAAWVEAQNLHTRAQLDARPGRAGLRERLTNLLSIGTVGPPEVRGSRNFHTRREGKGQNQPILYVREGLDGTDRPLVDPNAMSTDGTAALDWWYPSRDGTLVAYGISTTGDEKSVLHVRDVETGVDRADLIPNTRYCSLGWLPDSSGFYYTRYPAKGSVPPGQENYGRHVFFHLLGTDPAKDPEIFGQERRPEEMIEIDLSPDGRWLTVIVYDGWARTDLLVRDVGREAGREGSRFVPVAEGIDAIFTGGVVDGTLYLRTNFEAPRYRLLVVDPAAPERASWRTLIPEGPSVLDGFAVVGGRIVTLTMQDASSRVTVHAAEGALLLELPLPALGTVAGLSGEHDGQELFFGFSSYTVPPTVQRCDLTTLSTTTWEKVTADVDLTGLQVKQVFFPSKDGTRLSAFIVSRAGLERNGANPTLLHGYGGFNVSLTPGFSRGLVLWLERGGIYVDVNLRGGGEYGEAWHRAGMLDRKQNVFDDFIAAMEWLAAERYTRPDRLAIMGGSNGGLLVGAALTQRPDLFKAAICAVPLLDMVRYHHFQIARLWVPEYGSAESPEQFQWIQTYSPYQRVRPGTAYPAVLLTTAEADSRVDPMHARKMAARLQAATTSDRPILLRTESRAGHGAGKPLSKQIDEASDVWSFLLWQLGMEHRGAKRVVVESDWQEG